VKRENEDAACSFTPSCIVFAVFCSQVAVQVPRQRRRGRHNQLKQDQRGQLRPTGVTCGLSQLLCWVFFSRQRLLLRWHSPSNNDWTNVSGLSA